MTRTSPRSSPTENAKRTRWIENQLLADWWRVWLPSYFPETVGSFGPQHVEFWEWVWSIRHDHPRPFIGIWARGAGKSTSAELATVALGARGRRNYAVYVRATQELADRSVENIANLLESQAFGQAYPQMSRPAHGKYGNQRGWRRERLRTQSGFTVDAFGLDAAFRGAKVDEQRPDLIIFDDIDERFDSAGTTLNKLTTIAESLLPAGASNVAILGVQNLLLPAGIFAQLADGRADILADRIVSGPYPAVRNLSYEQRDGKWFITGGEAIWSGQDLGVCQQQMRDWGLTAFLREAQHKVEVPVGGMYDHLDFQRIAWSDLPKLLRTVVWVDPAVTETDNSDAMGIQADGMGMDGKVYRLWSWEAVTSPEDALARAIRKAIELGAEAVGVETDQGGDTWKSVYREAARKLGVDVIPEFRSAKAGAGHGGKVERSSRMLAAYERGQIVHVEGTHETLERSLRRFPKTKPLDLADAAYWSWFDLTGGKLPSGPPKAGVPRIVSARPAQPGFQQRPGLPGLRRY